MDAVDTHNKLVALYAATSVNPTHNVNPNHLAFAIADSGATEHYITLQAHCIDKTNTTTTMQVRLTGRNCLHMSHEATLNLPMLANKTAKMHVLPDMSKQALL